VVTRAASVAPRVVSAEVVARSVNSPLPL
jgi:hypothetical protein